MKNTKQLSTLFALLGVILLIATVALSFATRNMPTLLVRTSPKATQCTQDFMDAIDREDYAAASTLLAGQPQLDPSSESESALSDLLWEAYHSTFSYEFTSECYATETGLARDVRITALDIPAVMTVLEERTPKLLEQRVATTDGNLVYDKNNNYREDFVMDVLHDCAASILAKDQPCTSWDITLHLDFQNGQWQILPEPALMNVISASMSK